MINADERVEHGRVVDVMDDARQAGVVKMAIAVKPKDTPAVRDDSLSLSLLASCFIHGVVIILASIIIKQSAQFAAARFPAHQSCRCAAEGATKTDPKSRDTS